MPNRKNIIKNAVGGLIIGVMGIGSISYIRAELEEQKIERCNNHSAYWGEMSDLIKSGIQLGNQTLDTANYYLQLGFPGLTRIGLLNWEGARNVNKELANEIHRSSIAENDCMTDELEQKIASVRINNNLEFGQQQFRYENLKAKLYPIKE